jgi:hypothetical protein
MARPDTFKIRRGGISAQGYGDMPDHIYLRKLEQTCMLEDTNEVENYQRNILRDTRPDAPFLASDEARSGNYGPNGESRLGGTLSRMMLNIREHGARSTPDVTPYLPDGTFLDYEFLDEDPRESDEPQWKAMNEQMTFRYKNYTPFSSDADNSTVESGMTEGQIYKDMRRISQPWLKNRLKIFSTSKDGIQRSIKVDGNEQSYLDQVTADTQYSEMLDNEMWNGVNATTLLSNNTPVGWHQTVDHDFKVAQYGMVRSEQDFTKYKAYINRREGVCDQKQKIPFNDITVSSNLIQTISNIIRARKTRDLTGDNTIYNNSTENKTYNMHLENMVIGGSKHDHAVESRAHEIVRQLENIMLERNGARFFLDKNKSTVGISHIDPKIVEYLNHANKKLNTKIKLNQEYNPTHALDLLSESERINLKLNIQKSNPYNGIVSSLFGQSAKITNYALLIPKNSSSIHSASGEDFGSASLNDIAYKKSTNINRGLEKGYFAQDMEFRDSEERFAQHVGSRDHTNLYSFDTTHRENMSESLDSMDYKPRR